LLIVDDEPGPRESLRIVFRILPLCDRDLGREGIDLRTHTVDAAVSISKMPDLSGVDVLRS